jgi:hypothetical protein
MPDRDPNRALNAVHRIEAMCNFIEHPAVVAAVAAAVPAPLPPAPGALGFDVPTWVGLGVVGLWSALDGFSERAALPRAHCPVCGRRCVPRRFAGLGTPQDDTRLGELEDLRHLYAHNLAGEGDADYFSTRRHVLAANTPIALDSGGGFDGARAQLDLPHLRAYAATVRAVLAHFP